jgi:hypothetical protein
MLEGSAAGQRCLQTYLNSSQSILLLPSVSYSCIIVTRYLNARQDVSWSCQVAGLPKEVCYSPETSSRLSCPGQVFCMQGLPITYSGVQGSPRRSSADLSSTQSRCPSPFKSISANATQIGSSPG